MRSRALLALGTVLTLLTFPLPIQASAEEKDQPRWQRDPFHYGAPLARTGAEAREKEKGEGLEGIMTGEDGYRALFNGQVVREGERVDGIRIHRITPYSILVEDAAGSKRIDLFHD